MRERNESVQTAPIVLEEEPSTATPAPSVELEERKEGVDEERRKRVISEDMALIGE